VHSNRNYLLVIIIGVAIILASFDLVNRSTINIRLDNGENIQISKQESESKEGLKDSDIQPTNSSDISIQTFTDVNASNHDIIWILKSSTKTNDTHIPDDQNVEENKIIDPVFHYQSNRNLTNSNKTNVILISIDGFSRERFHEYRYNMTTITNLIDQDWVLFNVTNYADITQTRNGHATMLSGYLGADTGLFGNHFVYSSLPVGKTILEKAETKFGSDNVTTGFIAGKYKMIYPAFNETALLLLDYVNIQEQPPEDTGDLCISFLEKYGNSHFVSFVHFRDPDKTGHSYGDRSAEWQSSLINVDEQLDRIIKKMYDMGIQNRTNVYITTDHGFPSVRGAGHRHEPYIWLLTNDHDTIINRDYSHIGLHDIAPTICYVLDLPYNYSSIQAGHPIQLEYPQEKSEFRKKYLIENTLPPSIDILQNSKTLSSVKLQVRFSNDVNQLFMLYNHSNFVDSIISKVSIPLNTTKITLEIDLDIISAFDELFLLAYDFSENYSIIKINTE